MSRKGKGRGVKGEEGEKRIGEEDVGGGGNCEGDEVRGWERGTEEGDGGRGRRKGMEEGDEGRGRRKGTEEGDKGRGCRRWMGEGDGGGGRGWSQKTGAEDGG